MNAEGQTRFRACEDIHGASMRPRSNERGRKNVHGFAAFTEIASMRPRSNERGRIYSARQRSTPDHASMRPRSNERGRRIRPFASGRNGYGFNEAAFE